MSVNVRNMSVYDTLAKVLRHKSQIYMVILFEKNGKRWYIIGITEV